MARGGKGWQPMRHQPGHDYESYVVRLWRDSRDQRLLRAEIEHVQTGRVGSSIGPSWDHIAEGLRAAALTVTAIPDSPTPEPTDRPRAGRPSRAVL
jgi:hypothetical protein